MPRLEVQIHRMFTSIWPRVGLLKVTDKDVVHRDFVSLSCSAGRFMEWRRTCRLTLLWACVMLFVSRCDGSDALIAVKPRTGALQGWIEKHRPYVTCVWDLTEEKNLVAISLHEESSELDIVSLDVKTQRCSTSANVPANVSCASDDSTASLYAEIRTIELGNTKVYDCQRIYFSKIKFTKHEIFNLTGVADPDRSVTEDSNDHGTHLVITLGVTVSLLVIVVIILSIVIMRTRHQMRKQFKSLISLGDEGLHAMISGPQAAQAESLRRPSQVSEPESSLIGNAQISGSLSSAGDTTVPSADLEATTCELEYATRLRLPHFVSFDDVYDWHRPQRIAFLNLLTMHDTVAIEKESKRSSHEDSIANSHSIQTLTDTTKPGSVPSTTHLKATLPHTEAGEFSDAGSYSLD